MKTESMLSPRVIAAVVITGAVLISGMTVGPSATAGPADAAPSAAATSISTVAVGDDEVTVTGSVGDVPDGATVEIRSLGQESSATAATADIVGEVAPDAEGAFALSAPRRAPDGTDHLYSQYLLTVDGEQVGSPHFADDLQQTPVNTSEYPVAINKKGLQVQMTDDSEALGVQHAGINVDLADIMRNTRVGADDIVFESEGRDYYFDPAAVAALDTQIKAVSDNGTLVNLIVLVYRHDDEPTSAANVLVHPDAAREPGAGPVFGFNTVTEEGRRYTTAAMEFISSRWTRPDEQFGKAVGFIVGNEVDAQWSWSNSGEKTVDEFLDDYSRALRIMSLASRNFSANSRTYTSLTHAWTVGAGANPDPANPTRYYAAKDVVDKLNAISKATGDFPWYIAHHPYPADLFKPDFWNDPGATDDVDTELITFKNLQVLPRYLESEELLYNGEPRRIILSEQGCNTPGSGDDLTIEAEKLQAACYAFAYYKIRFLPSIDNFILHRHVDYKTEGGLNLGLWASDYSVDRQDAPLRQKYIYDVFKYIDTDRSLEVTDFAKEIIGIDDWADVIDGFDPAALAEREPAEVVGSVIGGKEKRGTDLGSFASGTDGWEASDNVSSVAVGDGALQVTGAPEILASQFRGVVREFEDPIPAERGWVTTSVRLPGDTQLGRETVARVTVTFSDGRIVEGDALLPADGRFHNVAVELPRERDATIAKMKIRVRGTGPTVPESRFDIGSVALTRSAGHSTLPNLLVTAATDSAELIGSTMTFGLTNLDARALHGRISAVEGCGDFVLDERRLRIPRATVGQPVTVSGTVASVSGDAATVCVDIGGASFEVPVDVPPPAENLVFDFEADEQGWMAGENVASVARVTSIANGPGTPRGGSGALEAVSLPVPAGAPRTVSVNPDAPIDLSSATTAFVWMNSWGGVPGATSYVATVTMTGADGTTVTETFDSFKPDSWNQLAVDVSGWDGRSAVTGIAVSFAAVGSEYPTWDPRVQIDDIGYFTS